MVDNNPYRPPADIAGERLADDSPTAQTAWLQGEVRKRLQFPVLGIIVCAGIGGLWSGLIAVICLYAYIIGDAGTDELLANGGGNTVLVLYNLLIGYANYRTLRLKSYASALWMATLVIIPCCSPAFVLGIPFGFWLLSILRDGDTMAAFEG